MPASSPALPEEPVASPRTPGTDFAATSRQSSPVPARRRHSVAWRVAVPLVAVTAGALFGVSSHVASGTDLRSGQTDLAGVVASADHRVKVKQHDVATLRAQVDTLQKRAAVSGGAAAAVKKLTDQASSASPSAGLTPLTGSSVTVTLNDSKESVDQLPSGGTADWLVVHQQDVQSVVNALWRGGAQGLMLMDQRIVSTSAVRCVGNTLILQGRVYSPPFTVTAIGDPQSLQAALDDDPAIKIYKQYVDAVGLGYDVKSAEHTTIPAFTGALTLQHAQVGD